MKSQGVSVLTFFSFLVFIFSCISLYVAISNYIFVSDRNLSTKYGCGETATRQAEAIQLEITQDKEKLDQLTTECEGLSYDTLPLTFVYTYKTQNDTIVLANSTCHDTLANLTRVLGELINGTNATSFVVSSGLCQFNSNVTQGLVSVPFEYRLLSLNGLSFYYYTFGASSSSITGPLYRIEFCSPALFDGQEEVKPLFVSGGSDIEGLTLGNEKMDISSANVTLSIQEGFQVWLSLF